MNRLPDGRLNPDDVFLTGIGWVHAQFAAEFPMIEMAMVARGLPIAPDPFASPPTGQHADQMAVRR